MAWATVTIDEAIAQLQALRAEHGGELELGLMAVSHGDYDWRWVDGFMLSSASVYERGWDSSGFVERAVVRVEW